MAFWESSSLQSCRLCLCSIKSRLPSSQPPSRLSCRLTHSSRGLFPSPELFLPSARKMNQCLALPINARELLLSCQCRMKEWAAYAPSLPCCPPTLTRLTSSDSTLPIPPLPSSFSLTKPWQFSSCQGNVRTKPSQTLRWPQHFTFQSGGSWAPNPRAGNILSLKRRRKTDGCTDTHKAGLHSFSQNIQCF